MNTIRALVLGAAAAALVLGTGISAQAKPNRLDLRRYLLVAHVKPGDPVELNTRFSAFERVMLNPQPLPPRYVPGAFGR